MPTTAMKGGSRGDKQGRSRLPVVVQVESSQLFRRVSVVICCFLFVLVFLLSTRHDVTVFDTLSTKTSLRAPAAGETLRSSTGHEVRNTTAEAVGTNTYGVAREAEPEDSNAAASTLNSDDDREAVLPGAAEAEAVQQDNAVHVTAAATLAQPAMETTTSSPQRQLPRDTGITTRTDGSVDQPPPPPLCDFSGFRADVCDLAGDIRLVANASTFLVVVDPAATDGPVTTTETHKVRPYPRKGDATAMGRVTELTVRKPTTTHAAPRCTATHASPAVAFSASGYAGNVFHDFTDLLVPLFAAAARYVGDVHLVVTDVDPRWLAKYAALLRGLSRHPPLDLAAARANGEVHCFRHAVVGLRAHRELLIDPMAGPTMPDFGLFLRRALSLPRDAPTRPNDDGATGTKPRMLIISRRGTRRLLNAGAVARAAEEAGFFEAAVRELGGGPAHDDVAEVGRMFNSFDAVVGVHGAGLTNMVFLPPGAAVVQIVPWGGLRWIARLDFGDAAEAMGLKYIQYEVGVEETTLKDKYPRDHEVFTNPTALHKKGFTFLRHTFLNGQDIIVDIERFRPVLLQVLNSLAQ
ncbi:hypothetical protein QOZ80_1BG0056070 [Eleusine coracana subsp. coracana]|nr:hypothetical protein QOZ80_1BG0056070 [Eleusine coracana subsp. coracana]